MKIVKWALYIILILSAFALVLWLSSIVDAGKNDAELFAENVPEVQLIEGLNLAHYGNVEYCTTIEEYDTSGTWIEQLKRRLYDYGALKELERYGFYYRGIDRKRVSLGNLDKVTGICRTNNSFP